MTPFKTRGLFTGNPAFGQAVDDPAAEEARERYLQGLRSPVPLNWLSPHLKEDQSDFGAIYVALRALMSQAAGAKVRAYKWHKDARMEGDHESKEYLPRTHPICRLLNKPNRWDSGRAMRARAVLQRNLTGSWLAWIVTEGVPWSDEDDRPIELWTVPTGTFTAVPMSPQYPNGAYRVTPFYPGPMALLPGSWQAGGVLVPAEHMIASRREHPLVHKEGLSPLAACAEELDCINGIGRARKSIIKRAPVPSGWLQLDSGVVFPDKSELNRIQAQLYSMLGSPDRGGRPAIFGPGQKWVPNELAGLELPWTSTWDQLVSFVLSVFGTTKTMVGMSEAGSYAALYAILRQNRIMTIEPELNDIADALNMQLVAPYWGEDHGIEFEPEAVGDDELLEKRLQLDLRSGVRTFNEWRQIRKLPLVDGPKGKEFVKGGGKDAGHQTPGERDRLGGGPREPKDLMEEFHPRPRNLAGAGSLPPRIVPKLNGNGKP